MLRKFKMGGVILGALLALAGCQSEKLVNDGGSQDGGQMVTLTASRGVFSRTEISKDIDTETGKRLTMWSADLGENNQPREQIYVSSKDGSVYGVLTLKPNTLKNKNTEGEFSGFINGHASQLAYSVYPVPENWQNRNEPLQIDLTTRTGKYVDAPMIGPINGASVQFVNTCGIQAVEIDNLEGKDFELTAKSNGSPIKLGTKAKVTPDPSDANKVRLEYQTTNAQDFVKINNASAGVVYVPFDLSNNKKDKVVFYAKVANSTSDPVQITGESNLRNLSSGALLVSNVIEDLAVVDGQIVEPVKQDRDDFNTATEKIATSSGQILENAATVTLDNNMADATNAVKFTTIPGVENVAFEVPTTTTSGGSEPTERVISFENIPTNVETLAFTESIDDNIVEDDDQPGDDGDDDTESEQPTPTEATQKVVVSLSESAENKTVDFNMPNSTINLQSKSGEELILRKVTAATADNTFIIEEGVVIESLVLVKGRVIVRGVVNNISISKDHRYGDNDVEIIIEGKGQIKNYGETHGCKFKVNGAHHEKPGDSGNVQGEKITIENSTFSAALKALFPSSVTMKDNCAIISKNFAESLTTLNLDEYSGKSNLTSLSGIHHFSNLEYLYCNGASLTEVDLTKNKKLRRVEVANNRLTKVNVYGLSNLTNLLCGYNYSLEDSILVTGTNLVEFRYQHTNATRNLVPDNLVGQLEIFDCGDNQLTSLDLSAYKSIRVVHVPQNHNLGNNLTLPANNKIETLDLTGTGISQIDLTQCPNLKEFYNQGNNVTSLNFSKCPNVWLLYTDGNKMTELDLTKNPSVASLLCGSQQENKVLTLKLPESLKAKWEDWKTQESVKLYGEDVNETITIENVAFSRALEEVLGKAIVTLDSNGFAVISKTDADSIPELNFENYEYDIPSLKGIEYFKDLIILNCSRAGLRECDLSKNTKLQYVYLFDNLLTSLDFSNQPELIELQCGHNNDLERLNVQNCSELKKIGFESSKLTSIDIPNWQDLTFLNYSRTEISFDLSQFTQLESFYAVGQGLTSLNFSETCKKTLVNMNVEDNYLTSFNFSEYHSLESFRCINNNISELDLSTATKLKSLNCDLNYITALDITKTKILTDLSLVDWFTCGNQKNNITLTLTLTGFQKANCTAEGWINDNPNVRFFDNVTNGNTSGENFGHGGVF